MFDITWYRPPLVGCIATSPMSWLGIFILTMMMAACQTTQPPPSKRGTDINAGSTGTEVVATPLVDTSLACTIPQQLLPVATTDTTITAATQALETAKQRWGLQASQLVPYLNKLAELYRHQGRFNDARPLYQQAIDILTPLGAASIQDLATIYSNFGVCERQAGNYTEAEAKLQQALKWRSLAFPLNHPRRVVLENNLISLLITQGRCEEAQQRLNGILPHLQPTEPLLIDLLNNQAHLHRTTGDLRQAELTLKRVVEVLKPQTAAEVKIRVHTGLADLYLLLGDETKTTQNLQTALKIALDGPNINKVGGGVSPTSPSLLAEIFNNISQLQQRQLRWQEAKLCQQNSLTLLTNNLGATHPDTLLAMYNLGILLYRSGDLKTAEQQLRTVLTQRQQSHPQSLAVADTLNALAGVAWASNRDTEVQSLLTQAVAMRENLLPKYHMHLATSYNNQAIFEVGSGHYKASLAAFAKADTIDANILEQILGFATEEQKLRVIAEKNNHLFALFSLVTAHLPKDSEAVLLAANAWLKRKGLVLEAQRRYREALIGRDGAEASGLWQDLRQQRHQLAALLGDETATDAAARQLAIAKAESAVGQLEQNLLQLSPSYAEERMLSQATVDGVNAKIPAGSVLVEIARFSRFLFTERDPQRRWGQDEYLAFLLSPVLPGGVIMVPLGAAAAIEEDISQLLPLMNEEQTSDSNAIAYTQSLYQKVFAPLMPHFPPNTGEVLLAPDGQLNLLPFEILRDPQKRFVNQTYRLAYLTSGRDLLRRHQDATVDTVFLLGDPNFDLNQEQKTEALKTIGLPVLTPEKIVADRGLRFQGSISGFVPLPGTRVEVTSIQGILGTQNTRLYVGDLAVEDVMDIIFRPRMLHLATHGFFLPGSNAPTTLATRSGNVPFDNPLLRAGLAFAEANRGLTGATIGHDGILTAEEALELDLRGTQLVVLSACQTGLGQVVNGEGVFGMRRAFMAAGTQGLIISLWEVPDQETQELMVELYNGILQQKLPPHKALQQARNNLLRKMQERQQGDGPFYWGAFIYQGHPATTGWQL